MREKGVYVKSETREEGEKRGEKRDTHIYPFWLLAIHMVHCICSHTQYLYLGCVCPELAIVLGIAVL